VPGDTGSEDRLSAGDGVNRPHYLLLTCALAAGLLLTDGRTPPVEVAAIATALGVVSLLLIVSAWRGSRVGLGVLVGLRLLSAASAVPAFVVGGVPAPVQAFAAVAIALTLLGCALVSPALRRRNAESV
jgi:Flp pilus assembly protein TadB